MTDGIEFTSKYPGIFTTAIHVASSAEEAERSFRDWDGPPGLRVWCIADRPWREKLCYFAHEAAEFFAGSDAYFTANGFNEPLKGIERP